MIKRKLKKVWKNILSPTPQRHRVLGQIKSLAVVVIGATISSGVLDNRPILKTVAEYGSGVLLRDSFNHAQQTEN
jgi:hypothetical protein